MTQWNSRESGGRQESEQPGRSRGEVRWFAVGRPEGREEGYGMEIGSKAVMPLSEEAAG